MRRAPVAVRICEQQLMYYILEWMLASSIPHVDGACIYYMAAIYFDIAVYICL